MLGKSFAFLLLLASLVVCQNYPRIGKLEGHFTSNFADNLYLCINGDVIQGSAGQFVILNGQVSSDGKNATGTFFQAGTFNCDSGAFEIVYNDEGFTGTHTCNRLRGETFDFSGRKLSAFRPTDDQCALLSTDSEVSLEGRWSFSDGNTIDICFKESSNKDSFTVHSSYTTDNSGSYYYPNEGFLAAYHYLGGRIVKGAWFEDYNGGAWLMFIRNTGKATVWKWTGLLGTRGATYVDEIQYNEPDYHQAYSLSGPASTTNQECDRNQNLDKFVLDNLQVVYPENPNGFYYFLDSAISEPDYVIDNQSAVLILSNGASTLVSSIALLAVFLLLC